jgi:mannose-1-phosphate guanylyltransferase
LVGDVALPLLRRGGRISAFFHRGPWDDIGDPSALLRANVRWLAQNGRSAWQAVDAEVGPHVILTRSIVGAGAIVHGAGELRDCVVFPGASWKAPSARVLAGRRTRLPVPEPG